ncbi:MAG: WD40 repeat domain-containing protein, partial [Fimbriimonadales bacterium]
MNCRALHALLVCLVACAANAQGMLEEVWSVDTGGFVEWVEISSDGTFVLVSGQGPDPRFVMRDMKTGEVTGQIVMEDGWRAFNPSLSSDGRFLVSYVDNGQTWSTRVYRLSDGALLRDIPFGLRGRLSPTGEYVYYADPGNNHLRKMRVSDGSIIWSVDFGFVMPSEWDTAVTTDGSRVAGVAFVDNQFEMMRELDAEDGTQVSQFPVAGQGHAAWRSLQYTHGGTRIAFARQDGPYGGMGLLYDVEQGDLLASLFHPSGLSMQFDAQSRHVATAGLDGWLRIWDGSSLSLLGVFNSLVSFSSDISDDGRFIVVQGNEVEGPARVKLVRNPLSSIIGTPESAVVKRGRTLYGDVGSLTDNDS